MLQRTAAAVKPLSNAGRAPADPPRLPSRAPPPTPRHARRRAEIVAAAARVFAARGFHGASTQDIADQLGIRQASLYYYFASKETALEAVCRVGVEGFLEQAQAVAKLPVRAPEKVARLIKSHLAPLEDRGDFVRTFQRERRHLPEPSRRRIGRIARRYERVIEGVLADGVDKRQLRADLDTRMATLALLGMCNAVAAWYTIEPRASLERIAAAFGALVCTGVSAT